MARRRTRRTLLTVGMVFALIGATTAAGGENAQDEGAPEQSKDWRMGYDNKFDAQLNPFKAQLSASYFAFTEVYDLFPYNWQISDAGPDLENSLVTGHEVSEDGLQYTFHLRKGVKWNDGEDFNADDVVFTYEAYRDAKQNVLAPYVSNMVSMEKLDDYTVLYTLKKPDARVLSAYTFMLPEHIWGEIDLKEIANFAPCCPMVGTGPFTITEYDPKGTTILTPNEFFYGPKGEIERILMTKYGDKEGQLRDIQLNQLDAVYSGDPKWVGQLEDDPSIKAVAAATPGFSSIAFNMCPPGGGDPQNTCTGPAEGVNYEVVQDQAIRTALAWAIDREKLVDTVYSGQATPGNGLISPLYERYYQSYADDPEIGYHYDPAKAKQILAEGGWACPEEGICSKDGVQAKFEMLVRSEDLLDQSAARRVTAWAQDVGIQIDMSFVTADSLVDRNYAASPEDPQKYEPDFDAFLWGWSGDIPFPDFNFEVTLCGGYWSDTFYCNPEEYDPLPAQALSSLDFQERVDLMHQAERIILRDSPYVFLAHDDFIQLVRTDTWTGYQPSPDPEGPLFSTSSLQLQLLKPGTAATTNYSGAPFVLIGMGIFLVAVLAVSRSNRRRDESGPLELAPLDAPVVPGGRIGTGGSAQ